MYKRPEILGSVFKVTQTYILPYSFGMGTDGVFMAEPVSNVIGGSLCFVTMLGTCLLYTSDVYKRQLVSVAAGVVEKRQSYGQLRRMNCWYAV